MTLFRVLAAALLALLVLGQGACSGGDGGNGGGRLRRLTLEEYFDELEGSSTNLDERTASVADTLATSDDLDELKEAASQYPDILGDFVEDLDAIEAPVEVAAAHQDAIDVGQAFLDLLAGVVDDAQQAETVDELRGVLDSDDVASASTAFTVTCVALQEIADDNAIDVDLGCEDKEKSQSLTLDEYLGRLDELDAAFQAQQDGRGAAYDAAVVGVDETTELQLFRALISGNLLQADEFLMTVEQLSPPPEAQDANLLFVQAFRRFRDVVEGLGNAADEALSLNALEGAFDAGQLSTAAAAVYQACHALESLAVSHSITLDMDCGEPE